MSNISPQGEQSTSAEISALANLTALGTSAPGEFLRKTGATTFENATPAGGSGVTVATPTGTVDGSNTSFTVASQPKWVIVDGMTYFETLHYTYSTGTITMNELLAPTQFIRAIL